MVPFCKIKFSCIVIWSILFLCSCSENKENRNLADIQISEFDTHLTEQDTLSENLKSTEIKLIDDTSLRCVAKSHFVNTTVSEYLPIFDSKNQILYFTAMDRTGYFDFKIDYIKALNSGGEDIFFSKINNGINVDARPLSKLNTNRHESLSHISSSGSLVLTANYNETMGVNRAEDGFATTDIFIIKPYKDTFRIYHFDEPVNSIYTEADAIYEEDDFILFVSDRPKGIGDYNKKGWLFNGSTWGNTDIYVSFKKGDYWSTPLNLGEKINTIGAERTPWLSDDKKTLYLSSNGYEGNVDLDVYYFTRNNINDWTEWKGPFKLTHLCTNQDDWGYKTYGNKAFISQARLLPYKTTEVAREGDGGIRETNYRANYKIYGLQTASLKKNEQTDIFELKPNSKPDFIINDILFNKDDFQLKKSYLYQLDYLVDLIKVNYNSEISIIGHTDSDGDSLYNMILSEKRAKSIKDYFISKKIKNKISIFGKGESKPAFSNNSKSNKEKNRRVEIFIK